MRLSSCGSMDLHIKSVQANGRALKLEALLQPKITSDVPSYNVAFDGEWKHLVDLELADPDFRTFSSVDMLLGADIISHTILYGRQFGPSGTPSAFETTFGWILAGTINGVKSKQHSSTCYLTTLSSDELLKQFWEVEDHNYCQPVLSSEEQCYGVQVFQPSQDN